MSQVFKISNANPIIIIVKIWDNTEEKEPTIIRAARTAKRDARVIVIPVLNDSNILLFNVPTSLFIVLIVSSMSVSTLYPINIKNATIPALEILKPNKFATIKVMKISANAEAITAIEGMLYLA